MTPIENLEERLAANLAAFNEAPADTGSLFELPPDGEYQASVYEFDFFEGGDPKQAYLKIVCVVEHDETYTGRRCDLGPYSLEDAERFRFLKADLRRLGAEPETYALTDLLPGSEFLKGLLDTPVEIKVVTRDKVNPKTGEVYRNVWLQKRLGAPGSAAEGFTPASDVPARTGDFSPPAGGYDDDDIPF